MNKGSNAHTESKKIGWQKEEAGQITGQIWHYSPRVGNILKNNGLYFYSLKLKRFRNSKLTVWDSDTLPVFP